MKLINAGLKTVEEAQIALEAGDIFYSPSAGQPIYFDRQFILKGGSPYRVQGIAINTLWAEVKEWKMEDKSEKHMTITPDKVTLTPPKGYEFDKFRCGQRGESYMGLSTTKMCTLTTGSEFPLFMLKKKEPTRRTWQLKYDDKRPPLCGQIISDKVDGQLYAYMTPMGTEKAYIWEEVTI